MISVSFVQETPATCSLPNLAAVRRDGHEWLANIDKRKDYNGFVYIRCNLADGRTFWTLDSNVRIV